MDNRPIGIFDSGVGGLSVFKTIKCALPNETLYYFGDCDRAPYGEKSTHELCGYTTEIATFLKAKGVKLMVIACNTTTAGCFSSIQKAADMPVIGVITPGARNAALKTENGIIGMIATKKTAESNAYDKELEKAIDEHRSDIIHNKKSISLHKEAISELVPLIEQGIFYGEHIEKALQKPLITLLEKNIDTLILGCTHFPLVTETIKKLLPNVTLVDPAIETAMEVMSFLLDNKMQSEQKKEDLFFVNGDEESFEKALVSILGHSGNVTRKRF